MPKIKLDKAYFWGNKTYLPGESVEVPDELAIALGQSPAPPIPNAEEPAVQDPPSEEVPPSTTPQDLPPEEDSPLEEVSPSVVVPPSTPSSKTKTK